MAEYRRVGLHEKHVDYDTCAGTRRPEQAEDSIRMTNTSMRNMVVNYEGKIKAMTHVEVKT